jgi:hypothetical protein
MGFFDRMFGEKKEYPELDPYSPTLNCLEKFRPQLEALSAEAKPPLEVIPGVERAFVFIGKPPKKFGIAWIEEGQVNNLKNRVDPQKVQALAERLRKIYEANQQGERFSAKLGACNLVVTPSDKFRNELREVIQEATH